MALLETYSNLGHLSIVPRTTLFGGPKTPHITLIFAHKKLNINVHNHNSAMGKRIIPPHDPERLAKVMDERCRMIGVRINDPRNYSIGRFTRLHHKYRVLLVDIVYN